MFNPQVLSHIKSDRQKRPETLQDFGSVAVRTGHWINTPLERPLTLPRHWQLRSLISAGDRHIIYFPGGPSSNFVQRLNTQTRECETIKFLTFVPRCLVAKDGWLCCGSEGGEFVSFRTNDQVASGLLSPDAAESQSPSDPTESNDEALLRLLSRSRRTQKQLVAKNAKMADERVNCITLWSPPDELTAHRLAYTFQVAVLANNDKTVTMVNLWESEDSEKAEPFETIRYPDYVNRAIISPDGRLLVAILDDPFLYVHERVEKGSGHCWQQKQRLLLKSQNKTDQSNNRGSFAASFSSTGSYLAVGTQHGTVSIFDAKLLAEPHFDPLITTFQSSKPKCSHGAIRDMAFCPGPFDILAWSEDRGNVGLADSRTNFAARQIISISDEADFEHIGLLDRSTVDPRLLDRRNNRGGSALNAAERDTESTDRPERLERRLEVLNYPLTPNETMVLEALQGDRRRRERLAQRVGEGSPASRTPQEIGGYLRFRPGVTGDNDSSRLQEHRRGLGDLLGSYREQRDRANDRVRSARQLLREASNEPPRGYPPSSPGWSRQTSETNRQTLARVAETLTRAGDRHDSSYLDVLDILQARERGTSDDDRSSSLPLVSQVVSGIVPDHSIFDSEQMPDHTAGLAWSQDGRTL